MGTRLLCWVTFCQVTQELESPSPPHPTLGQGLEFMKFFRNSAAVDQSGMPNARFSAERPGGSSSALKIERAEPGDSAVYLCASSLTTAWHGHILPVHKPHVLTAQSSQNL
ncbi:T Cell Receptor Beta Variable 7-2 [Manis pentadactyla]|nr:T Cell Receptor Beta Variable 7-2 [Manis pentadactyla]